MLCLKKRRTYSFSQGACSNNSSGSQTQRRSSFLGVHPRNRQRQQAITARQQEEAAAARSSSSAAAMVLTVTEDTPADMLAGSMELLVQMPRDQQQSQSHRVTVQRSTPMMDLLVQIATAHKLSASSYSLQAIGERGLVLPYQPNTPIGALEALQVNLLPKQASLSTRKSRQPASNQQPFETTFRLQVHLPRNQLYVSRVSPKTPLAEILQEVCREKNLERSKYELRHPGNPTERLDPSLTLHDYQLQEVCLCPLHQGRSATMGSAVSTQDIMALHKQEECRRQQTRHSVFSFIFGKSKDSTPASQSPSRSSEATQRSSSPIQQQQPQQRVSSAPALPSRPHRKRRPAPKPPTQQAVVSEEAQPSTEASNGNAIKDKLVISHSRNSSDSSGYHEASVLSDNPESSAAMQPRMPETLPRRSRMQGIQENGQLPRKLAHTSQASKSLGNLAMAAHSQSSSTLGRGISNSSLNSQGQRKKRAAPAPPVARPLPSAISSQALERIIDSDESLTSDMELSKPSSDIDVTVASSSKASSDIACHPVHAAAPDAAAAVEPARVVDKERASSAPVPRPRKAVESASRASLGSCESNATAGPSADCGSFGLPSLTEDEREEIAQAIDSIDEAARAHEQDEHDEVFEQVPEAFRDQTPAKTDDSHDKAARSCAVISTIPKCDRLEPLDEQQFEQLRHEHHEDKRRAKVGRSQSEMGHFELGSTDRHPRHLTSNGEAFTFALNPNLGPAVTQLGSGTTSPMETDVLLQKVSDTLSHSLSPPSPPPTPESANVEEPNFEAPPAHSALEPTDHKSTVLAATTNETTDIPRTPSDIKESTTSAAADKQQQHKSRRQEDERSVAPAASSDDSNVTLGSATSDYVSATGEDLSIADWDYQIPAPPSAFRDDSIGEAAVPRCSSKSVEEVVDKRQSSSAKPTSESRTEPSSDVVDACHAKPVCARAPSDDKEAELKKAQVINELESKIQSNRAIVEPAKDDVDAPKIAPVENNLSNFTITSYSGNKNLDIFEPMDARQIYSQTRTLSTFATLTRGKTLADNDAAYRPSTLKSAQSMERVAMPLLQNPVNFANERPEIAFREKPVHRSKSYIVLSSNDKFQNRANLTDRSKDEICDKKIDESPKLENGSIAPAKKFTSTTNLTSSAQEDVPSHKQKFSQWRDNILERHKEPSMETQLQSLQVLKSILPQLQKSQALENKSTKITEDVPAMKQPEQQFRFDERDSSTVSSEVTLRPKARIQEPSKRYTYCGPPAVSLGSWSERPSLNVQIKTDTDYKFGGKNSASGARTIVNLNGSSNADDSNVVTPLVQARKEEEKNEESCVDTTSVNFRDLAKTFGQSEVRLRGKPLATGRNPQHRFSEYLERPKPEASSLRQNAFAESNLSNQNRNNAPVLPVKRYTSVVGITNNNNNANISNNNISSVNNKATTANFKFANGSANKPSPLKAFCANNKESVVPKPPTMPIITGVTLKSVNPRPKSGPSTIQADPRDLLLESIRKFGRDKLKSLS